jgi:hypothetical protein
VALPAEKSRDEARSQPGRAGDLRIEHCGARYSCRRNGATLEIEHRDFARPLQISIGRLKPSTIVAAIRGYHEAITGGAS